MFSYDNNILRLLANDDGNSTTSGCIAASSTTSSTLTDTEIIHNTCSVYLSIFAVLFITFLIVRQRYPHIYNIKKFYSAKLFHNNDTNNLGDNIAENEFGKFNWTYKLFTSISDTDIRDQCGMDAVTTIRLLEYGVKLSLVGIFNSFFLLPIYKLCGDMVENYDPVKEVSLSNLGQGSDATISTTLAAYIFFGAAMYLMSMDFDWFLIHRYNYLSNMKNVQNYSVFLSNLPIEMQTNESIMEYFQTCFLYNNQHNIRNDSEDDDTGGVAVNIALSIPKLEKEIGKRTELLPKLEHAINIQNIKGKTPMHKQKRKVFSLPILCGGKKVDSISTYSKELEEMNADIYQRQKDIRAMYNNQRRKHALSAGDPSSHRLRSSSLYYSCVSSSMNDSDAQMGQVEEDKQLLATAEASEIVQRETADSISNGKDDLEQTRGKCNNHDNNIDTDDNPTTTTTSDVLSKSFQTVVSSVKSIISGGEDGSPRNAAFVTFANFTSANIARQTVHQLDPVSCIPVEPPKPEFVNWKNVGTSNHSKQLGELFSLVLTCTLCLFWTVPVSFVASLSNVEALTERLPFLKWPVENYSWFSSLLALLAPLLLVAFISLLPIILLVFVKFEKLIEIESYQHPSLFSKLAVFTILQTFFISTIASTLFASLEAILRNPSCIFSIVAEALPSQSAYFIQIIIVQNMLSLGLELLRITPIATNLVRTWLQAKLGHDLTEKEQTESPYMGLRALDDPLEYYFARELGSKTILVLMVLYVYGCMSPVTTYFTLLVFGFLAIGYRHQFIYIYPIKHDSGGKLWINFHKLSVVCMIMAELILLTVLLLKGAFIAAVLMMPLVVASILFYVYFKRRYYPAALYLPLGEAAAIDRNNKEEYGMEIFESFKCEYLQPALKETSSFPENYSDIKERDTEATYQSGYMSQGSDHNQHTKKDKKYGSMEEQLDDIMSSGSPPGDNLYKQQYQEGNSSATDETSLKKTKKESESISYSEDFDAREVKEEVDGHHCIVEFNKYSWKKNVQKMPNTPSPTKTQHHDKE